MLIMLTYVRREYFSCDMGKILQKDLYYPTPPGDGQVEFDSKATPKESDKIMFQARLKARMKWDYSFSSEKQSVFALLWGQLSELSKSKVFLVKGCTDLLDEGDDPLKLVNAIVQSHTIASNKSATKKHEARKKYYNRTMGDQEKLHEYFARFKSTLDTMNSVWNSEVADLSGTQVANDFIPRYLMRSMVSSSGTMKKTCMVRRKI